MVGASTVELYIGASLRLDNLMYCGWWLAINTMSPKPKNGLRSRRPKNKRSNNNQLGANSFHDAAVPFRVVKMPVHNFARTIDYGTLTKSAVDQGYGYSFSLIDFPSISEFNALYDSYKFLKIQVTLDLVSFTGTYPTVLMYPDYDDANAPVSLDQATQIMQMERLNFSSTKTSITRTLVPRVASTVSGVSAVNMVSPWIDMAYTSIPHYGLKFWIKNYNTSVIVGVPNINLSFRYFFSCRNPR